MKIPQMSRIPSVMLTVAIYRRHQSYGIKLLLDNSTNIVYTKLKMTLIWIILKKICVYFSFFIAPFGLMGNIFTFAIYSTRAMKLRKSSVTISLYFRCLSITNSVVNLQVLVNLIQANFNVNLSPRSDYACQINQYIVCAVGSMSSWLLVVISLDRFINIAFPRKFPLLVERNLTPWLVIALLAVFNLFFYFPMIWNSHLVWTNVSNGTYCTDILYVANYWMNIVDSCFLPFLSMIFLNILLMAYIKRSRMRIALASQNNNEGKSRDRKFAITSFCLNFSFFIFNLPLVIYDLTPHFIFISISPELYMFLFDLTLTLWNTFYALDFYIQLLVNSIIREQFFRLLRFQININPSQAISNTPATARTHD
jgi:hypothetical protein